jgi:hypothetical protein
LEAAHDQSGLVLRVSAQSPRPYLGHVKGAVNAILDKIVSAMKRRERVELRGFGAISARFRRPLWAIGLTRIAKKRSKSSITPLALIAGSYDAIPAAIFLKYGPFRKFTH